MANPVAGWYPDPSGDTTKLRYWNGMQWEENFMPAPVEQASSTITETQVVTETQTFYGTQPAPAAAAPATQPIQPPQAANPYQPVQQPANPYQQQPGAQAYQPTPAYAPNDPQQIYAVSESDSTLRLVAFVLNILTTVACAALIIPLAWMIPMTVHSWGIYKGRKANTVAFGVCTLLFINLISGILLLVSTKER